MERYVVTDIYDDGTYEKFRIFSVLYGQGSIRYDDNVIYIIKGETYFIPANLGVEFQVQNLELLKNFI